MKKNIFLLILISFSSTIITEQADKKSDSQKSNPRLRKFAAGLEPIPNTKRNISNLNTFHPKNPSHQKIEIRKAKLNQAGNYYSQRALINQSLLGIFTGLGTLGILVYLFKRN